MNRKQRRAVARKKNVAAMGDIAGAQEDIGLARTLYLSAPPGAGASRSIRAAGRKARELVRRRLHENPRLWGDALGLAVDLVKGGKWEDAMNTFHDIAEVSSGDADALAKTGLVLFHYGRSKEAEEVLSRAVELDPSQAVASNNLGSLYLSAGRPADAVVHFKNAQAAQPELVEPYINLCSTLANLGDWDQAKVFADMTFELADYSPRISPNLRKVYRGICDFEGLRKLGDLWQDCEHIKTGDLASVFLGSLVYADDAGSIRRLRDLVLRWAQDVEKRAAAAPLPARAKGASRVKLRVGILSADLSDSSVARFLTPLMRSYDRERFEIYCYTPHRKIGDPIQFLYRESVDKFTFVDGMKEREIAAAIQADDVDILLELNGFTAGSRIESVAYKPAPVQMSWYGYPFTSGLAAVDYCIMDQFVVPSDESLMVEEPIIMPGSWLCFGEFPDVEITQGLPADRNGRITFGTLNNPYKLTPKMIALWAQVMNRVPGSRLLVVRSQASSIYFCNNLTKEFAKHGVSADRLFFFDNKQENKSHLSYYNDIDISLDTFPLTGGTTTCEATWMGVPVITLVGESFHQRISYTMLMNCGLEEFCTFTPEDFVDRAVALAGERDRLLAWRHGLRGVMRQSPLCDEERFLFEFQEMLEQVAALHGLRGTPASAMVGQGGG
ncbi:MAG: tetratricopeptide repeat protein [Proteobacteria bacterium]|nr:tetratricopeptide repeat protein [Pseudomonadota bacterium]